MTHEQDVEAVRAQFIAVIDPLDLWLCVDGNYVRPATRQERTLLARVEELERKWDEELGKSGVESMRCEAAEAENERLREALREIAEHGTCYERGGKRYPQEIARAALGEEKS